MFRTSASGFCASEPARLPAVLEDLLAVENETRTRTRRGCGHDSRGAARQRRLAANIDAAKSRLEKCEKWMDLSIPPLATQPRRLSVDRTTTNQ